MLLSNDSEHFGFTQNILHSPQGQGLCEQNSDCQTGLVCRQNSGDQFGLNPFTGVCVQSNWNGGPALCRTAEICNNNADDDCDGDIDGNDADCPQPVATTPPPPATTPPTGTTGSNTISQSNWQYHHLTIPPALANLQFGFSALSNGVVDLYAEYGVRPTETVYRRVKGHCQNIFRMLFCLHETINLQTPISRLSRY